HQAVASPGVAVWSIYVLGLGRRQRQFRRSPIGELSRVERGGLGQFPAAPEQEQTPSPKATGLRRRREPGEYCRHPIRCDFLQLDTASSCCAVFVFSHTGEPAPGIALYSEDSD